jgi:hypothetical protein
MYIKLPGGRLYPGGYIVPCDVHKVVKDTKGGVMGAYVRLSSEDGQLKWVQYTGIDNLISNAEAEREEV